MTDRWKELRKFLLTSGIPFPEPETTILVDLEEAKKHAERITRIPQFTNSTTMSYGTPKRRNPIRGIYDNPNAPIQKSTAKLELV